MQRCPWLLLLAALLLPLSVQAGSTLRCGSALISLGDSRQHVASKCGEPADQARLGYREKTNRYGHVHHLLVEEWSYGPRNGMYHTLRFEGGLLVKISSTR